MKLDVSQRLSRAVNYHFIKNMKKLNFFSRDFVIDVIIIYINMLYLNVK